MFEFELKKNANGNVDYIYSVGSGRFGGAEMPYPQARSNDGIEPGRIC